MAFLIPSAPRASVPYGSLDEPEILLSSDTRSDSSLLNPGEKKAKGVSGTSDEGGSEAHSYVPEYGEHMRNAPDCEDLVLDYLTTLCFVAVDGHNVRRWSLRALVELLLRAYIKHRSQHVRNYAATNYQSPKQRPELGLTHFFRRQTVDSS